jgi:hypothetical protein
MLDLTLATAFEVGTNLKGTVAGANWLFLLPDLKLGRAVCVGTPAPSALCMVARFAREVVVLSASERERQTLSNEPWIGDIDGVALMSLESQDVPRFEESTVDLIWIAGRTGLKQLANKAESATELWRGLSPDGVVYLDPGGTLFRITGVDDLTARFGAPQRLWLTPFLGEMQTAVPDHDEATIAHFLKEGLHSQSMGYGSVKALKRLGGRKGNSQKEYLPAEPKKTTARDQGARFPVGATVRSFGRALMHSLQSAERYLVTHSPGLRRYGAFFAGDGTELTMRPPRYLRLMAREAGIDIDSYRWGLSARGNYNTRKVLFFLFNPASDISGRRTPDLVVKIVRQPSLNYRLENEFQTLRMLSKTDFAGRALAPEAAFFGLHRGLAVVAETMIQGAPFLTRTRATADCDILRSAVDWIVDLGVETADSNLASSEEVAGALEKLLDRFCEIYRPADSIRDFLVLQIAAMAGAKQAFPLVFQHGDPGTWNAVVTAEGRVTFLDWEAAEPAGMPLWDLFYFQRSYCMVTARKSGIQDRQAAVRQGFLEETPFNRQLVDSAKRYCEEIGLPAVLVEPLFFTCWMHRALKEAASLTPASLKTGHYVNLLSFFIDSIDAVALRRLFSSGAKSAASDEGITATKRVALT